MGIMTLNKKGESKIRHSFFIVSCVMFLAGVILSEGCVYFNNASYDDKNNAPYLGPMAGKNRGMVNITSITHNISNASSYARSLYNAQNNTHNNTQKTKLLVPGRKIYLGAFPDFSGEEDNVTGYRIESFIALAGKKIAWAYFSNNWYNGIVYPKRAVHIIHDHNITPFIRLMPRSDTESTNKTYFSLRKIAEGYFDNELRRWARDAKKDNIPLLVDFAVEMNGDWFPWGGIYNGGPNTSYGNLSLYDGPELYKNAYRHIIDIFREENVTHVTWFFHPDIISYPDEEWNKPAYYYPGDDYIDWIGVSVYGPMYEDDDTGFFSSLVKDNAEAIKEISDKKPIALLEFGVADVDTGKINKSLWLKDAFETIINRSPINFSAVSYWHEKWEEEDNLWINLRIDSSQQSTRTFRHYIAKSVFAYDCLFSGKGHVNITASYPNNTEELNHKNKTQKTQNSSLWIPRPGLRWQWQLENCRNINTNYDVDVYDIDLFDSPQEAIDLLHSKGIKVICYFSAGTFENYRNDSSGFPDSVIGNKLEDWPDERWLDVSNYKLFSDIMLRRLALAAKKKCDAVEADNVDAYENNNGFDITYDDQLRYNKWLAEQAHKLGLSIGLKNDLGQVNDLVDYFDFAVNEECFYYNECEKLLPFIKRNKAVFGVEYGLSPDRFCRKANSMNFSWLKMEYSLSGERTGCESFGS